jgi:hypothetical protein
MENLAYRIERAFPHVLSKLEDAPPAAALRVAVGRNVRLFAVTMAEAREDPGRGRR